MIRMVCQKLAESERSDSEPFGPRIILGKKQAWGNGLMVMGGDSFSKGHEFESRHRILDGHFFTYIFVVKICNVCLKRRK